MEINFSNAAQKIANFLDGYGGSVAGDNKIEWNIWNKFAQYGNSEEYKEKHNGQNCDELNLGNTVRHFITVDRAKEVIQGYIDNGKVDVLKRVLHAMGFDINLQNEEAMEPISGPVAPPPFKPVLPPPPVQEPLIYEQNAQPLSFSLQELGLDNDATLEEVKQASIEKLKEQGAEEKRSIYGNTYILDGNYMVFNNDKANPGFEKYPIDGLKEEGDKLYEIKTQVVYDEYLDKQIYVMNKQRLTHQRFKDKDGNIRYKPFGESAETHYTQFIDSDNRALTFRDFSKATQERSKNGFDVRYHEVYVNRNRYQLDSRYGTFQEIKK